MAMARLSDCDPCCDLMDAEQTVTPSCNIVLCHAVTLCFIGAPLQLCDASDEWHAEYLLSVN